MKRRQEQKVLSNVNKCTLIERKWETRKNNFNNKRTRVITAEKPKTMKNQTKNYEKAIYYYVI